MDYRCMIAATKMLADSFERILGKRFCQVHSYLPRLYNLPFSCFLQELVVWNVKIITNHFLNGINCDFLG